MEESTPSVRGLVVDDDPAVVELLGTLLRRRGIVAEAAEDGNSAASLLRAREYDLAFIDLILPAASGETLMRQFESGALKRPVSVALISAAPNLANVSHANWARNVTLLSKPFAPSDISSFIDRAFSAPERKAAPRPLLFAGSGLWVESASLVAMRRGARCLNAPNLARVRELCEQETPLAVVFGPPNDPIAIGEVAAEIKDGRNGADISVYVALANEDVARTAHLLTVGVDRVVSVGKGVAGLSEELLRIANLKRRIHRRVPLAAPVMLHAERAIHMARAFDVGEGGIGVEMTEARPSRRELVAEFTLPGDSSPITAKSEVAWIDNSNPDRGRLGLRFTDVNSRDRIRSYVAST